MASPGVAPTPPSSGSSSNSTSWLFSYRQDLESTFRVQRLLSESISLGVMLLILLTFFIAATKHRLWHSNPAIDKTLKYLLAQMVGPLTDIATFYLLSKPLVKIYVVWGAILMIGHGILFCIAEACTLKDSNSVKILFIGMLTYNFVDVTNNFPEDDQYDPAATSFVINLWVIWGLMILRAAERFFSFEAAKRTYGVDSIYSVSNYLRYHQDDQPLKMSDTADPVYEQGHKYIISGEGKISFRMEMKDENKMQTVPNNEEDLSDKVITLDKLRDCEGDLLRHPKDLDGRFKDICLSFALMKLLRRRFLDNPGEELIRESKASILQDLMIKSEDVSRVFRVIKTELGFLVDFFFSKYPIVFGYGLPICNYLLSLLLMAATGSIVVTSFSFREINSDFFSTFALVAMIFTMEITEITIYVLSDWTKVALLIIYVQFPWLQKCYLVNLALKFFCKSKILQPVRETVGQFSLLRHYQHFPIIKARPRRPTHAPIKVPVMVKKMIVDCLTSSIDEYQIVHVSNGEKSLERNSKKEELGWACELPLSVLTILVWHIATCYCETKSGPSSSTYYKDVATTLSNYCAHLVVNAPDLLLDRSKEEKLIFDEKISEMDTVLEGAEDENAMWEKMMQGADEELNSRTAARMGAKLGKKLVDGIKDEGKRWKVLGEFWAEYILYLASSNNVQAHKEHLASGGEFITQLWVLLYHVGILERPEKAANSEGP